MERARHLLVVDDDREIQGLLHDFLVRNGFRVSTASDGKEMARVLAQWPVDLVILDLMLPEISGLDVCRTIRAESDVPIIMVTAKDSEADKVTGLELGADDYVTKPFSVRELVSRVRAHLRRANMRGGIGPAEDVLRGGPVEMDVGRHEVRVRGEAVGFPPKEFELLEMFLRNPGRVLTRGQLIDRVWGSDYVGDTKTLDVHVKRLRAKLEPDPANPKYLLTVRGLGYKFEA